MSARRCFCGRPGVAGVAHGKHRCEEVHRGDDVLVNHPWFGSVWMSDCFVKGASVVGQVEEDRMFGHVIYAPMNFPLTCVRKIVHHRAASTEESR